MVNNLNPELTIQSPINGGKVRFIEKIRTADIIQKYQKKLNIDVSPYIGKTEYISIYECESTQYRFFYPLDIDGDDKFYEALQDTEGYYLPWKWEHQKALERIAKNDQLLEIGSARGAFLEGLVKHFGNDFKACGLELNADAANVAKSKKMEVMVESVQSFSQKNPESFDVVCFFQVLEHISDIKDFITASLKCLKPGGKLILSVPNNDSFIKDLPLNILNLPPHHMGLWNEKSLQNLAAEFNIKSLSFEFESLSPIHVWSYYHAKLIRIFGNNIFSKGLLISLLPLIWYKKRKGLSPNIIGHTILAVFEKK